MLNTLQFFLEFCVLVDFRIRQEIRTTDHVNTFVLYEYIEHVALIADIPNFFSPN